MPAESLSRDGCYLVAADGTRYLDLGSPLATSLASSPATEERFAGYAARLRAAFAEECAAHDVHGELVADGTTLHLSFAGQENATAERILQAFHEEMRAASVRTENSALQLHPEMDDAAADLAEHAVRRVVRRLRTLLVEHNSYLTGGLTFPFADEPAGVAARGLAIYRFPAGADVDVVAFTDHVHIGFAPADLGEVTSSGFYLPTLFVSDFTVEMDYVLGTWSPGATDAACFALFAQNEASSHRYYAQRMSTGIGPHRLLASLADELSAERDVDGDRGAFRITRRGDEITCFHPTRGTGAKAADWVTLGRAAGPVEREMILGAKIWAKIRCEGLEARIYNLKISGELAARQVPPVPIRRDPRSNQGADS